MTQRPKTCSAASSPGDRANRPPCRQPSHPGDSVWRKTQQDCNTKQTRRTTKSHGLCYNSLSVRLFRRAKRMTHLRGPSWFSIFLRVKILHRRPHDISLTSVDMLPCAFARIDPCSNSAAADRPAPPANPAGTTTASAQTPPIGNAPTASPAASAAANRATMRRSPRQQPNAATMQQARNTACRTAPATNRCSTRRTREKTPLHVLFEHAHEVRQAGSTERHREVIETESEAIGHQQPNHRRHRGGPDRLQPCRDSGRPALRHRDLGHKAPRAWCRTTPPYDEPLPESCAANWRLCHATGTRGRSMAHAAAVSRNGLAGGATRPTSDSHVQSATAHLRWRAQRDSLPAWRWTRWSMARGGSARTGGVCLGS